MQVISSGRLPISNRDTGDIAAFATDVIYGVSWITGKPFSPQTFKMCSYLNLLQEAKTPREERERLKFAARNCKITDNWIHDRILEFDLENCGPKKLFII